jgi:hypothetical protein
VGERSSNELGRLDRLVLTRKARGNPETDQLSVTALRVNQNIAGFDVLVNETGLMQVRD